MSYAEALHELEAERDAALAERNRFEQLATEIDKDRSCLRAQLQQLRDLEDCVADALRQERSFLIDCVQCDCPAVIPPEYADCEGPTDELCHACWEAHLATEPWKVKP